MADLGPDAPAKPPFSRIIAPDGRGGAFEGRIEADASERADLAQFYRIDDLAALTLDWRLDPLPSGGWRLTGDLRAELTQLCVVTRDSVAEEVREDVSLEFWPEHLLPRADVAANVPRVRGKMPNVQAEMPNVQGEIVDILAADPPEPIVGGRIDLGHLTAEIFASAINPYPRKAGAEFDWTDPKAKADGGPFAALGRLKDKP
jgi:hypothetical protein